MSGSLSFAQIGIFKRLHLFYNEKNIKTSREEKL